ncbi:MAG: 50S ribosomal protein L4, partial [Alphaproteobacteria bacterium]|nr:50S ribosomal protein L4 [Alphaproteobacteria bacterium]
NKMKTPLINLNGDNLGEVELNDSIFAVPVRKDILQRVVVWQLAKKRGGNRKTKSRGEMAYSRRKIIRQKGSGHARRGDRRTNILRGGGTAHGPVVRSHEIALPRRIRRHGLRCALSAKAAAGDLHILDNAQMPDIKTKIAAQKLSDRGWHDVLFLESESAADTKFILSVRNIKRVRVMPVSGANVHDILRRKSLVLTQAALKDLETKLS